MTLTGTISDDLKADPDEIWAAEALPNTTSIESDEFLAGRTQGDIELVIELVTELTIAGGQTVDFDLLTDDDEGGSYAESEVIKQYTNADSPVAAGTKIRFQVAAARGPWCKVKATCSADQSTDTVNAFLRRTPR